MRFIAPQKQKTGSPRPHWPLGELTRDALSDHLVGWAGSKPHPLDPSAEFFGMFGRLSTFFGRYSASRKFLGGLRPAFFRRISG